MSVLSQEILADLARHARHARHADESPVWPGASWAALQKLGGLRWSIPQTYGGEGLSGVDLLERYEALAGECLTTCFLLSQRDAACRRLIDSGKDSLCSEILPQLVIGKRFATVGLAQLTTSHQHTEPPVTARQDGDVFIIDGVIPWVTGAARADHIVMGAVTDAGKQILGVMGANLPGVIVEEPLQLMAMDGSLTGPVRCKGVRLPRSQILAGPADHVLASKRGGTGGLETSCLAIGLTGAAVRHLLQEAKDRPQLADDATRLEMAHRTLRQEMLDLSAAPVPPDAAQSLRARANTLVLRATQAALAVSKGAGFVRDHPAQRWARQALFFLVWSCPWQVTAATMARLSIEDSVCS
ncbi:MAG: acyl-CoA/acyl-ACP dehydrogenase [Planctomycetes bacterium]|nr:acyl-CoA/acyl-ACP dehydrogenase [Planctomycetota bacterium]